MNKWICFCDESYFGKWAVRPEDEKRWGHCFHVGSKDEAEGLCELLNETDRLMEVSRKVYMRLYGSIEGADSDMLKGIMDAMNIIDKEGLSCEYTSTPSEKVNVDTGDKQ